MPVSRKRTYQRHSEPKLFQCTGFGDCHMVFTRSEHLARHARKHTGEKPFKCVVPGCERAFSRFDNMIQHTSTHNKKNNNDKKSIPNKKYNSSKENNTKGTNNNKNSNSTSSQQLVPLITSQIDMGYSSLSPPPPASRLSLPSSPISDTNSSSPRYHQLPSYLQHSPTSASVDFFPQINSSPSNISPMHPTFLPSPKELLLHQIPIYPLKRPMDDYYQHTDSNDTCSSTYSPSSPASISFYSMSPPPLSAPLLFSPSSSSSYSFGSGHGDFPRRLSNVELALPIQELSTCHGTGTTGVNITSDEFEALQAFSQLSSPSSTRGFPFGMNNSRPSSMSFNIGTTQVNALRQSLALAHESSSRLSPRSSI